MFLNLLTSGSDITDSCRNFNECLWENSPELKPVHFDCFSSFSKSFQQKLPGFRCVVYGREKEADRNAGTSILKTPIFPSK